MAKKLISRIAYIDITKGVAMILVVMHHCGMVRDWGMEIITMIDVPLFFLCSGFLAYKTNYNYRNEILKKAQGLLLPFVLALLLISVIRYENPLLIFLHDITKSGYWFFEALFIVFLIWYCISALFKTLSLQIVAIIGIELILLIAAKYSGDTVNNILILPSIARYFPCFAVGIALRKFGSKIVINKWVGLILLIIGIIGFSGSIIVNTEVQFFICILAYSCWALLFFQFIQSIERSLPSMISNLLTTIGKHSLTIYLIHFFLIPPAPLFVENSFVLNFCYSLIMAITISFISIIIGRFLIVTTPLNKVLR